MAKFKVVVAVDVWEEIFIIYLVNTGIEFLAGSRTNIAPRRGKITHRLSNGPTRRRQ